MNATPRRQLFALTRSRGLTASPSRRVSPATHQVRNLSDTLIWRFLAPDDGNDLIRQVCFDWVCGTPLVHLDQRTSESIGNFSALHDSRLAFDVISARWGPRCSLPPRVGARLSINRLETRAIDGTSRAKHCTRYPQGWPQQIGHESMNVTRDR